VPLLSAVVLVS